MVRHGLLIAFGAHTLEVFTLGNLPYRSESGKTRPSYETKHWMIDLISIFSTPAQPPTFIIPIPFPEPCPTDTVPYFPVGIVLPSDWYLNGHDPRRPALFEMILFNRDANENHSRRCRFYIDFTRASPTAPFTVCLSSRFLVPLAQTRHYMGHFGIAEVLWDSSEQEEEIIYVYEPNPNPRHSAGGPQSHDSVWMSARMYRLHFPAHRFLSGCPTGRYVWSATEQREEMTDDAPGHIYVMDYNGA